MPLPPRLPPRRPPAQPAASDLVFVGVKKSVVALHKDTGQIVWETKLGGGMGTGFVLVLPDGDRLYAHAGGEVHCLDAATGRVFWNNPLSGFGYGFATLGIQGQPQPNIAVIAAALAAQQAAANSSSSNSAT